MAFDDDLEMEPMADLPASPRLTVERPDPYGGVPGLDPSELADPRELERMAFKEQWGPILDLPEPHPRSTFRPDFDEDGTLGGAFGSVDFARLYPSDGARYKADKLAEELRITQIRLDSALERVPRTAKYQVLEYFRKDVLELPHIVDDNMRTMARMDARAHRLREEIGSLREFSWRRQHPQDE